MDIQWTYVLVLSLSLISASVFICPVRSASADGRSDTCPSLVPRLLSQESLRARLGPGEYARLELCIAFDDVH